MRQIIYGYDPSVTRLQRVLEITRRSLEINKKASGNNGRTGPAWGCIEA
jgi:hypothetical protein